MAENKVNVTRYNRTKKICNNCMSIWENKTSDCPECGSTDIEDYHELDCDCKYCEQGYAEFDDYSIEVEDY